MNPQYVPQPLYSVPSSQGYAQNRTSSSPQPNPSFQNVPLGPPKGGVIPNGPPHTGVPPQSITSPAQMGPPGHFPPNMGPPANTGQFPSNIGPPQNTGQFPPRSQIPSSQLPPTQGHIQLEQRPPSTSTMNQFQPPPSSVSKPGISPLSIQNGPPSHQFQNGPSPQGQNGQSFVPPSLNQVQQQQQQQQSIMSNKSGNSNPNFPLHPPASHLGQNELIKHPPIPAQPSLPPASQPLSLTHMPGPGQNAMPGQPPILSQPPMPSSTPMGQPSMPGNISLSNQSLGQQQQAPHRPDNFPPQPSHNSVPYHAHPGQALPPRPGNFPPSNQPNLIGPQMPIGGQPPHPGSIGGQPMGANRMPPPSGPGNYNQPPLTVPPPPNQYPGPNQITNQMQNMNVGGPMPYIGAPINAINGSDNGPHMPPPLNQQQYINGPQQMRGPPGPGVGYPPMPGQPPMGVPGAYPQQAYQQLQQAKKLDPDQMPNPIQVTQDDQRNRSGIFCTNQKGLVPPLVTTDFVVQDQGNASPRFIRSTMYNVPISQDIMKQTAVPFSLAISPMARTVDGEYPPPIVNFGELGPVRCIRCKAYMCPFMQFIDSGRRFQCLFCKATTDVPSEYFQHLDHTGQRMDRFERPELVLGTYEMVATTDYCRNNTLPKPPAVIFIIDVSYNNVKSGLVHLLCSQMKDVIKNLPVDQDQENSNMRVGFITYNSSVHFYNIKGTLAAPQMLVVGDTQEMFMPLLDGFLCTPEESSSVIDSLMQQIPAMFGETRETETILLPAILAGLEALKASECTGKLMVFHSSLPTAEAPGKLKNRDDRKLLGTEKERTVLIPQNQAYNQLGQDCVAAGCSVDLFIFNNAYIDIATIGQVSRLSGGEVYKYTYFQADIDGERLISDIITDISRPIAFDAIMRVRTSTGVRPTDFYGHFFMSNTTDMELASIDCDKSVAVEIKHDDKLSEEEGVYVQAALLYTSCSGQRRLRILNLSLKTCSQMADLYRSCDSDAIINYIAKQSVYKLLDNNPKAVKDNIVNRTAQILATYRKNCASPSSAGQLILPECMKLLPLYVNCALKSDAIAGGSDMTIDDRSFVMQAVMTMDIPTSVNYFYPRVIPIHELNQEPIEIPSPIRCTVDKMSEDGVYILENGIHLFIWIGLGADADFIQQVFGVPSAIQVDIEKSKLPELNNPISVAVRALINEIRIQRHRCMRLTLVRQREKLEPVYKHFLAEDRGTDGSPSYVDFLVHMHKEIRSLLS